MSDRAFIERRLATTCPSTLRTTGGGYSFAARRNLFAGKTVEPIQVFGLLPTGFAEDAPSVPAQLGRLSLSGMQEKDGLTQVDRQLVLTGPDQLSTHVLKPIPDNQQLKRREWMPANEHLTMQLAAQVFDIRTAASGRVFTPQIAPMYLTRRFDRQPDGSKWAVEDFAALAGRTPATHGENYKVAGSYVELFAVLRQYVGAYIPKAMGLFKQLIFNYLVCNGDAHFRNFSLIETRFGDFMLAPAYDLVNTSLHVNDTPFALDEGLLPKSRTSGKIRAQFEALASKVGLPPKPITRLLNELPKHTGAVTHLIAASNLPEKAHRGYLQGYQTRLHRLLQA